MNLFSALVAIAAIFGVVAVARYWFESRRHEGVAGERLDQLEDELRERIENLERIVVDQRDQLKRKIDEL